MHTELNQIRLIIAVARRRTVMYLQSAFRQSVATLIIVMAQSKLKSNYQICWVFF